MARITPDQFGDVIFPGDGYAYRGPEYTERFEQLELASPGATGWIRLPDGSFRSWKKVETVIPPYIRELVGGAKYLLTAIFGIYLLGYLGKRK